MDKHMFKKSADELQSYLQFKRKGSIVRPKKGRGSYCRKSKYKEVAYG